MPRSPVRTPKFCTRRVRTLVAAGALATAAGCLTWQPVAAPEAGEHREAEVLVTTVAGERVALTQATLRPDSVVGLGRAAPGAPLARRAVARRDVLRVEARRADTGRTYGAVALTAAALGALVLLVAAQLPET